VVERYDYDPYGQATVLSPTWAALGSSAYGWIYLHQGGRYDSSTGLYNFRNRDYSPTLGRWVQQDPVGLEAGDTNLYRDVANNPMNLTDSSGLVANPPYGSWEFWRTAPQLNLNITGASDRTFVETAIKNLDARYNLSTIPWISVREPGAARVPPERLISSDAVVYAPSGMAVNYGIWAKGLVTPAQLARINIRVNLLYYKEHIVRSVYDTLKAGAPTTVCKGEKDGEPILGVPTLADYEAAANDIADVYIRAVDAFFKEHYGARPMLESRGWARIDFGNKYSAPWCADWAAAMYKALYENTKISNPPANLSTRKLLTISFAQYRGRGYQHNFVIVYPVTYTPDLSGIDKTILIFDPWRDLLPRVYHSPNTQTWMNPNRILEPRLVPEP
jgi:RHS repeat-associated protein